MLHHYRNDMYCFVEKDGYLLGEIYDEVGILSATIDSSLKNNLQDIVTKVIDLAGEIRKNNDINSVTVINHNYKVKVYFTVINLIKREL